AFRAWAYSYLIQLYGKRYDGNSENDNPGVPLVLTTNPEGLPRSTVKQVYDQITGDLDLAIELLKDNNTSTKTHINYAVANGIRARVALTMEDWDNAIKYARVARTDKSLMSNQQYLEGFSDVSNPEWLWGASIPVDQVTTYGSFFRYMSANFNSG